MAVSLSAHMEKLSMGWSLLANGQLGVRKVTNLILNASACALKRTPLRYPPVLMIDPANICNLRCTGCLTVMGGHPKPPGVMSLENFKKLVDEVRDTTVLMVLYNSGEPFLNPSFYEMVEYLTSNKVASITSTNGHLFDTEEKAERLVRSGLYMMVVSLSGATQEVYEKYHQRGNLEAVVENIKRVTDARKRLGRRTPLIKMRFLVMEHNEHEVDEMRRLAKGVGADRIDFRYIQTRVQVVEGRREEDDTNPPEPPSRVSKAMCFWPWLIAVIHWDGTVVPCCHLSLRLPEMGNVFLEGGLGAVWRGAKYSAFRRQMAQGKEHIPACKDCVAEVGFQNSFNEESRTIYVKKGQAARR